MKKNIKKQFMLVIILIVFVSIISYGKENNKNFVSKLNIKSEKTKNMESKDEKVKFNLPEEKGIDEEFTTNGKLNENKFLNKMFSYTDTDDSFKIEKDDKGYFITDYIDETYILEKEVPIIEEKSRLIVYKDVYLVTENGNRIYAYDTKLKKLVFINSNFRIFLVADEVD